MINSSEMLLASLGFVQQAKNLRVLRPNHGERESSIGNHPIEL